MRYKLIWRSMVPYCYIQLTDKTKLPRKNVLLYCSEKRAREWESGKFTVSTNTKPVSSESAYWYLCTLMEEDVVRGGNKVLFSNALSLVWLVLSLFITRWLYGKWKRDKCNGIHIRKIYTSFYHHTNAQKLLYVIKNTI